MLILLLAIFSFVSSEIPQGLSDSTKTCETSCLKTFPTEKSNSVEKLSDACQRGCRFFLLVNSVASLNPAALQSNAGPTPVPVKSLQPARRSSKPVANNDVVSDPQLVTATLAPSAEPVASARTNSSKEACQASCMEAYKHTRERYACHEGCANMARETSRAEERLRQALLEEGARELASLAAVGPLISSMFSQLYSAVGQPRFAVLVTEDDDARSEDVFLLEQPQQQQQQPEQQEQTIFLHASDSEPDDVLTDPALLRQLEASSSLDIALRLPEQRVRTFPAVSTSTGEEHTSGRFSSSRQNQHAGQAVPADLLACLSTRYGVPKWLLGLLALITGIMTAWLCLEPWDRAAILEDTATSCSDKTLLVETDEEEEPEKLPLGDTIKIPLV
ncbi:hypothetical protein B566_EDAN010569 [Ephemera danica]|nr:hypothetical protein B566_EDAN010569 [Ephemera danica]